MSCSSNGLFAWGTLQDDREEETAEEDVIREVDVADVADVADIWTLLPTLYADASSRTARVRFPARGSGGNQATGTR